MSKPVEHLELQPVTFQQVREFVAMHHRHNPPSRGWKFGIGVSNGEHLVGVVMCGRPVARHFDDGWTLEVNRCCVVSEAPKNAASMLYGAAWRAARAMGYRRIITYTRSDEAGTSIKGAGWRVLHETRAQRWNRPARPRSETTESVQRTLWTREAPG